MRRPVVLIVLAAALTPIFTVFGTKANACMIDNKPSAYANGTLAATVKTAPTVATYKWWAHFAFPRAFRAGERIHFSENDAQVRKALQGQPDALRRPWRWVFADGHSQVADRVTHAYKQPGRYKLSVEAYFPSYGWQAFDTITVTVRR